MSNENTGVDPADRTDLRTVTDAKVALAQRERAARDALDGMASAAGAMASMYHGELADARKLAERYRLEAEHCELERLKLADQLREADAAGGVAPTPTRVQIGVVQQIMGKPPFMARLLPVLSHHLPDWCGRGVNLSMADIGLPTAKLLPGNRVRLIPGIHPEDEPDRRRAFVNATQWRERGGIGDFLTHRPVAFAECEVHTPHAPPYLDAEEDGDLHVIPKRGIKLIERDLLALQMMSALTHDRGLAVEVGIDDINPSASPDYAGCLSFLAYRFAPNTLAYDLSAYTGGLRPMESRGDLIARVSDARVRISTNALMSSREWVTREDLATFVDHARRARVETLKIDLWVGYHDRNWRDAEGKHTQRADLVAESALRNHAKQVSLSVEWLAEACRERGIEVDTRSDAIGGGA